MSKYGKNVLNFTNGEIDMDNKKFRIAPSKFRTARKEAGYSVEQLAEEYGYSVSLIEKYEKGGAYITELDLRRIGKLLKVEPADIIEEDAVGERERLKWQFFLDSIAVGFGVQSTYNYFQECVIKYCLPYWEQLSKKKMKDDSCDNRKQKNLARNVYNCTRKVHFKKKDLNYFGEIISTFFIYFRYPENALNLQEKDPLVFNFFMDQIPKIKSIIEALKIQATTNLAINQPNDIDNDKLDEFLSWLERAENEGKAIRNAQEKQVAEGFYSPEDFLHGSDEADYWEDVASGLDVRLPEDLKLKPDGELWIIP